MMKKKTLKVILVYNVIEIIEGLADHRDVSITTVWETPNVQEVGEYEIIDIIRKQIVIKRWKCLRRT